ncbi:MAG: hypothetical protein K0R98_825 [Rickettsiaceae bacterium]|jgi:TPR repeat protein|nr:hypothetical protein [Rickettsiaceae bacterium]
MQNHFYTLGEIKEDLKPELEYILNEQDRESLYRLGKSLAQPDLVGTGKLFTKFISRHQPIEFLRKLEYMQDPPAAINFIKGCMYADCLGKPEKALELFTKAAEQGDARHQLFLGEILILRFEGMDVSHRNFSEGKKWLQKAAEQGNTEAQDTLSSFMWLQEQAQQGNTRAKNAIEGLDNFPHNHNIRTAYLFQQLHPRLQEYILQQEPHLQLLQQIPIQQLLQQMPQPQQVQEVQSTYQTYMDIGSIYFDYKEYREAKKWYLKAAKIHPTVFAITNVLFLLAENPTNKGLGSFKENCQLIYEFFKYAHDCGDFNSLKNFKPHKDELTTYIASQSPEVLKDMLVNMAYVNPKRGITGAFTKAFLPTHIKSYYRLNEPIYEIIASLPKGVEIIRDARLTQRQQRKDLFNTIDIFSNCGLPSDVLVKIANDQPKAGVPVKLDDTTKVILGKAKILKGTVPQKQAKTTSHDRQVEKKYTDIEQYESNKVNAPKEISAEEHLDNLSKSRKEFFSQSILERIINEQAKQQHEVNGR